MLGKTPRYITGTTLGQTRKAMNMLLKTGSPKHRLRSAWTHSMYQHQLFNTF